MTALENALIRITELREKLPGQKAIHTPIKLDFVLPSYPAAISYYDPSCYDPDIREEDGDDFNYLEE